MKVICIFHSRDLDGWASGAIVKRWCGENNHNIKLIGWDYGQEVDLSDVFSDDGSGDITCDALFICDVMLPKEIMENLYDKGVNMIWCDHHESSLKEAENMNFGDCDGIRSINFAGCELTWQYCYPDEDVPIMIEYLGKYDSHREMNDDHKSGILYIQYAARAYITGVDDFEDDYFEDGGWLERWIDEGAAILTYVKTDARETYKKQNFPVKIGDNKFVCVPRERFNPSNYDIDYESEGYDGAMCFWYRGSENVWEFSIYNENGELDVSEIAKKMGGGGHKAAAGFTVDDINSIIKPEKQGE